MRFTSIKIENYRQYKDIVFDFKKATPYDLHVIIAVNGAGKTNLLNAINWCLYGDEPHTAGTDEQDVPAGADKLVLVNKEALQEMREAGEKYCSVRVRIEGEDGGSRYVFARTAEIDVEALSQHGRDSFEVTEYLPSGETNIYGSADHTENPYNEVRDMLLPQTIREYFFFDGDQLLDYFGNNSANAKVSHLRSSIYEISQVSVVEKAKAHLVEREKDISKRIKNLSTDLEGFLNSLETACSERVQKERDIEDLEGEIKKAKRDLAATEKALSGTENITEDNARLNENREELRVLKEECDDLREQTAMLIRKYLDRFLLYDINADSEEYIHKRLAEGSVSAVNIDEMKASLDRDYKCVLCGEPLRPERIREFQDFVNKYESNVMIQTLSSIHPGIHKGTDISGYPAEKAKLFESLSRKTARIRKLEEENERLFSSINLATEDLEGLKDLGTRKKHLSELIEQNLSTCGKYQQQLTELKKKEEAARARYETELEKSKECRELARKQRFLQKAIAIITDVIGGIVNTVKRQLEEKTFELFQRFVWDAERFDRIELDDYFRLRIYDAATKQSCLRSCSAGEKELLALSFTLAIHEVSGYDNMLFIDTPVGRLSGINRSNFTEVLKEVSEKKQIILAFTDTEFSAEVASVFTENILSSYVILDGDILETKKGGA